RSQHRRRCREAPVTEERDEAAEDCPRGAPIELLMSDGARQRLIGRSALRREPAQAVTADERAHHGIAGEGAASVGIRLGHGDDYSVRLSMLRRVDGWRKLTAVLTRHSLHRTAVAAIVTLGFVAASFAAEAQQPSKVPRIGVILDGSPTDPVL